MRFISRLWKKFSSFQFFRFLVIGTFNTVLDFLIVNFLAFIFGVYQGFNLVIINTISLVTVVTISFFLNKSWTFRDRENGIKTKKKYFIFFIVTLIGLLLNNLIVYLITTVMGPQFGLSDFIWLNFSKALAVGIVLFWNFFNYKYIVFK